MRLRVAAVAVTAAALLVVPVALAATEGSYAGALYQGGERVTGSNVRLLVRGESGDRFTLRARRMRLRCSTGALRLEFVHRGIVVGDRIDDTRILEGGNNEVRVTGTFTGRRFSGRVRVTGAPGVRDACTGAARVRAAR